MSILNNVNLERIRETVDTRALFNDVNEYILFDGNNLRTFDNKSHEIKLEKSREFNLSPDKIAVWSPSLFESKGGIQVYSAYFVNALSSICPNTQHQVFLKHDVDSQIPTAPTANITYHTSGQTRLGLRTAAFATKLFQTSIFQSPDLIIATHLNFTPVAWGIKKLTQRPYWAVAHGIDAWNIKKPLLKIALKNADRILAVSHYTRDRLIAEQQLDPAKVVVLPNTFDSDRFTIASKPQYLLDKYKLNAKQPTILTVSRLAEVDRHKGYDRVLEALPTIRAAIPDIHYIIVGTGNDRSRIEQLIARLDLQDCVTLAGFIPDEQLCDYYNLCDVFAMPSQREGFGIVYLEALACGKPCLGGDRDGAIDALCHGKLGALVNPHDLDEIARTLIGILQRTYPHPLMYQPQLLRAQVSRWAELNVR
jgi:glycosyltransferase involved in cell wall biosynthesis